MVAGLTARQKEVLDFISSQIVEHGYPPTFREIGAEFNIKSTNGVRSILTALERKGYVRRSSRLSRGIELVAGKVKTTIDSQVSSIPIIGRIAAGSPILAEEHIEGTIPVDNNFIRSEGIFALEVHGDSMINDGIHNGDYVFARQQNTAQTGEIVVAVIGDEATVKRFYPEKKHIRLEPANEAYGPIIVEKSTPGFYIAGKIVGLIRKM